MRVLNQLTPKSTQDIDNIAKRILDSLKGLIFEDDALVSHCLAAPIDATMDYELDGSPPSDRDTEDLLKLLADESFRRGVYVEIGPRRSAKVNFGEVV